MTLSGATTPGLSGPGKDGNEGVLHISESPSITENPTSDYFASYPRHSSGESYPHCRETIGISYSPSRMAS